MSDHLDVAGNRSNRDLETFGQPLSRPVARRCLDEPDDLKQSRDATRFLFPTHGSLSQPWPQRAKQTHHHRSGRLQLPEPDIADHIAEVRECRNVGQATAVNRGPAVDGLLPPVGHCMDDCPTTDLRANKDGLASQSVYREHFNVAA